MTRPDPPSDDDGQDRPEAPAALARAAPSGPRLWWLFKVALAATLVLVGAYLLPWFATAFWKGFVLLWPMWLWRPLNESTVFLKAAALAALLIARPRRIGRWALPAGLWDRIDGLGSHGLRWGLTAALTAGVAVLLAGWAPHYLTWPWWTDTEYFAVTAQAWDAGILPYRDLFDFNFPGPTYLHWLLGHAFGWGRTVPFQAFDAALLVVLGALLAVWGRARFGSAATGLAGFFAALTYYLSLDYTQTAQRDWQAPMFAVFSVLILEARRGRTALAASGVLFALALSFRPHPVVFLPALLSALDEHARPEGGPWASTARAAAWWSGVVALGLVAAAAPVVIAGVAGDFAHWFKLAWYGGRYDQHLSASRSFGGEVLGQLARWQTVAVLTALAALAVGGGPRRRTARTWGLALACVLLYKPLSPFPHNYLTHPLMLVWSVALAAALGWAWGAARLAPSVRVLLIGVVLFHVQPWKPMYWQPRESLVALGELSHGRAPARPPPGCNIAFHFHARGKVREYLWADYQNVLAYLRARTGPRTRVAGFFRGHPFPTVNGPVGRLPVFPSPGGILWLRYAAPGLEGPFVAALARDDDAVVVWGPDLPVGEGRLRLERLEETIRRLYEPEARFGSIEVWRRKPVVVNPREHQ